VKFSRYGAAQKRLGREIGLNWTETEVWASFQGFYNYLLDLM